MKRLKATTHHPAAGRNNDVIESYIQTFKQRPSSNYMGSESAEGINAHELFSHYTADIIKEDIIFTR